jgi:hypothetical protein
VIPLGHRTYLAAKAKGDNSMFGKAGADETTKASACRDPDGMVNAILHEPKYPCSNSIRDWTRWFTSRCFLDTHQMSLGADAGWIGSLHPEHAPRKPGCDQQPQGYELGTYSRPIRHSSTKCGIAYGARALWQRSLRSSQRWGKPTTRRREAGESDGSLRRYV